MILPRSAWALSGAGTLAALHVGAINALWQHTRPDALIGTSAGSIVGACAAMGKKPSEMRDIVVHANYEELIPIDWLEAPLRGYAASNRNVTAFLRELTEDQAIGDCEIPLTCIASDMWTGHPATFSTEANPDMPIWQAVLASMSIPDVFPMFDNRYVDGGVMCNLGIPYLPKSGRRIGLRVTESSQIGPLSGWFDEQERLIGMMLSASETELVMLAQVTGVPVLDLPGGNLGFLNRGITKAEKESLYQSGYEVAQAWIESDAGKEWLS